MADNKKFYGYKRTNGDIGIRNNILIISVMDSVNPLVRKIAAAVKGTIAICSSFGRQQRGEDLAQRERTLIGIGKNPNTAGALIISFEEDSAKRLAKEITKTGKKVEWLAINNEGGTINTLAKGIHFAKVMIRNLSRINRELAPISKLVVGVKCGGSDTTSGLSTNPVTGKVADWIVHEGGTIILSETIDIIGAEHLLASRAASEQIANKIISAARSVEEEAIKLNIKISNLSYDHINAGLSTMEEKSLGAILKGGNTTINEFINYAEIPKKKGLIFMDSLGGGTENITGISAAGAQVIIFTTGTGNPIGSPVSPTIKICGNYNTIINQGDDIDLDVSDIFRKEKTINDLSVSLKRELLDVCNGKMTCSEILENTEIAISIVEGCGGRKSVVKSL